MMGIGSNISDGSTCRIHPPPPRFDFLLHLDDDELLFPEAAELLPQCFRVNADEAMVGLMCWSGEMGGRPKFLSWGMCQSRRTLKTVTFLLDSFKRMKRVPSTRHTPMSFRGNKPLSKKRIWYCRFACRGLLSLQAHGYRCWVPFRLLLGMCFPHERKPEGVSKAPFMIKFRNRLVSIVHLPNHREPTRRLYDLTHISFHREHLFWVGEYNIMYFVGSKRGPQDCSLLAVCFRFYIGLEMAFPKPEESGRKRRKRAKARAFARRFARRGPSRSC